MSRPFRAFDLEQWPAPDRTAWISAMRSGDLLEPGGPAAEWRATTRKSFVSRYGNWLGWLNYARGSLADTEPASRITTDAVLAYVNYLQETVASTTVYVYLRALLRAASLFAPDQDWRWLRRIESKLRLRMRPSRDKRLNLPHPEEWFKLGLHLMDDAELRTTLTPRSAAVQFRDGLMLCILGCRAPRRGVLEICRIGKHLVKEGDRYWLIFDAEETKHGRESERFLPRELTPKIDRYIAHHRQLLIRGRHGHEGSDALWLNENGAPLKGPAITFNIRARTNEAFGFPVPPHRARDACGTYTAVDIPDRVDIVAPMLEHADSRTGRQHYIHADAHLALRRYGATLEDLRRELQAFDDSAG